MFKFLFTVTTASLLSGYIYGSSPISFSSPNPSTQPSSQNSQSPSPGNEGSPDNPSNVCLKEKNQSPILILSMDGASVRGIAQFELLKSIQQSVNNQIITKLQTKSKENNLKNYSMQPDRLSITDMFDFFAGTSAGSVNVGAILIPEYPAISNTSSNFKKKNKPLYDLDQLEKMLPETLTAAFSGTAFRKIRTLGGLLGTKFTAKDFETLLQKITGKARMADTVKPFLSTSYDFRAREIMNFSTIEACRAKSSNDKSSDDEIVFMKPDIPFQVSKKAKRGLFQKKISADSIVTSPNAGLIKDINIYLWEAIRAASAAPVYYKPYEISIRGKNRALVDAGLFVMSPTLLAWVEAQKYKPFQGRRFIIISISSGTLLEDRQVRAKGATAGSIPDVLKPTIETSLEGQQILTDQMMKSLPGVTYHRLTFDVKSKEFDDLSEKNLQDLRAAAKETTQTDEYAAAIHDIVKGILERQEKNDLAPFRCEIKDKNIQGNEQVNRYKSGDTSEFAGKKVIPYTEVQKGARGK